ncbi:MAG: hypothetical protein CM15mP8_3940 [Methanobacteriota archaeon]|nr:MAG: hypothetical protein CM15mP8_3940 [Euryarchaeota archaeon]
MQNMLESAGEYTQGAGSGAILIRQKPRLLEFQILLVSQRRLFTASLNRAEKYLLNPLSLML